MNNKEKREREKGERKRERKEQQINQGINIKEKELKRIRMKCIKEYKRNERKYETILKSIKDTSKCREGKNRKQNKQ